MVSETLRTQLHDGRLYLHGSHPSGPFWTTSFPVEDGYVVFPDTETMVDTLESLGIDPDPLPAVCSGGTWDARCVAVEAILDR